MNFNFSQQNTHWNWILTQTTYELNQPRRKKVRSDQQCLRGWATNFRKDWNVASRRVNLTKYKLGNIMHKNERAGQEM